MTTDSSTGSKTDARSIRFAAIALGVAGSAMLAVAALAAAQLLRSTGPAAAPSAERQLAPGVLCAHEDVGSLHDCAARCAPPPGVSIADLEPGMRSAAARRLLLCADFECGRIDHDAYLTGLAALDTRPEPAAPRPPEMLWATTIRKLSSEYSTPDWSGYRLLGPPDVYPAGGDNVNAWASMDADGGREFVEVGFDQAFPLSGIDIYETFNPGAVTRVELITASGNRAEVLARSPGSTGEPSLVRSISFACTDEPIAAVRVELTTSAIPGWNEIDAIGAHPCHGR